MNAKLRIKLRACEKFAPSNAQSDSMWCLYARKYAKRLKACYTGTRSQRIPTSLPFKFSTQFHSPNGIKTKTLHEKYSFININSKIQNALTPLALPSLWKVKHPKVVWCSTETTVVTLWVKRKWTLQTCTYSSKWNELWQNDCILKLTERLEFFCVRRR